MELGEGFPETRAPKKREQAKRLLSLLKESNSIEGLIERLTHLEQLEGLTLEL